MLDDFGLKATLEWLCKDFSGLNEIPCSFEGTFNEKNFSKEIKTDLFRICQELFSNVINHSNTGEVKIRIEETDKRLQLSVSDTGKGFETDQKKQLPGLVNVKRRIASINGRLKIYKKTGDGTRICITINKE